uniref:uncharacterized protein isoform X2 n=1 Tax=Pristiophorus japonicus TaxID=55135 RepID=UPI00398E9B0F
MLRDMERIQPNQPNDGIQERFQPVSMDNQPEIWIGRELRRIGDDFNSRYQTRARNHRPPNNQNGNVWHWVNINILRRRRINGV